jgi:hypothetical protein
MVAAMLTQGTLYIRKHSRSTLYTAPIRSYPTPPFYDVDSATALWGEGCGGPEANTGRVVGGWLGGYR